MTTTKCPNPCCTLGSVPDKHSTNGLSRCPLCHGTGRLTVALPCPPADNVFSSDFHLTRHHHWREASGTGEVHGIPSLRGKALATDGVLMVIELSNGDQAIVHLDNWVRDKKEGPRESAEARLARRAKQAIAELCQFE